MKYKFVKQHNTEDCGAACLCTIAKQYGLHLTIPKARQLTNTNVDGTTIFDFVEGARKIHLNADALKGTITDLLDAIHNNEIAVPFVAHVINEFGAEHFVVVHRIKRGALIIADPAEGIIKLKIDEFESIWTGYIVNVELDEFFDCKENANVEGQSPYFEFLKKHKKYLFAIAITSIAIAILGVCTSFTLQIVVDEILDKSADENTSSFGLFLEKIMDILNVKEAVQTPSRMIATVCGVMIIMNMLQCFMQYIRGVFSTLFAKRFDEEFILKFAAHLVDLPNEFYLTQRAGDIINRYANISEIKDILTVSTLTVFLDAILIIVGGLVLLALNATLCLVAACIAVIFCIIALCFRKAMSSASEDVMRNDGAMMSFIKEIVDGNETIKSTSSENWCKSKIHDLLNKLVRSSYKEDVLNISQGVLSGLTMAIGCVVIIWLGAELVYNNVITLGMLLTFYTLTGYFFNPLKNVIDLQPNIQKAIVAARRLEDVFDTDTDNKYGSLEKITNADVDIRNLSYYYGRGKRVLHDVNLKIEEGSSVGIVGKSGCGKTTFAKILSGIIEYEKGQIVFNGQDIRRYSKKKLRQAIQYVPQEPFFFSDTIKNNLILGVQNVLEEDITRVCLDCNSKNFIDGMPFGLDTRLEENAHNISAGQRQRLAISRALLQKPSILILDEATSNIDSEAERIIKSNMFSKRGNNTLIWITHNLDIAKECDKIVVFEEGKIVEEGSHEELLIKKGRYYNMIKKNTSL